MQTKRTYKAVLVFATLAIGAGAAQAAQLERAGSLPILVDRYYEIKDPAGPVTKVVPEKLKRGPELKTIPQLDPQDIPNPLGFGQ